MKTIFTINAADERLDAVIAEMKVLGTPEIRACWQGDAWYAIEGSNRVAAAEALDLDVIIIEVDEDDEISDHDIDDLSPLCTVREIMEYGDWMNCVQFN